MGVSTHGPGCGVIHVIMVIKWTFLLINLLMVLPWNFFCALIYFNSE